VQARPEVSAGLSGEFDQFFGYQEEIARIAAAVARRRLVTLTGPGGSGKSRVALRVARALADGEFAVAGVTVPEGQLDTAWIRRRVAEVGRAGRPVLLVVDNVERTVRSCARELAGLLAEHPALHLLVTSREALRTSGEVVFGITGLPAPVVPVAGPAADVLRGNPAVGLFLDRAGSAGRTVPLDTANCLAVAQICRTLDGNPLAIELAGSLTSVLPVTEIAGRLDQCLELLTRGYRTAAPHQHSLQACLDRSLGLLSPQAHELLDYLGVFAGDFTLAAVEVVCADLFRDALDGRSLIDVLTELVDKHLVVRRQDWFRLSAQVRQYTLRNLRRTGRWDALVVRHTAWCGWLADRIAGELDGADDTAALALLDQESGNLAEALHRAGSDGARIAEVLVRFWLRQDAGGRRWPDGYRAARAVLADRTDPAGRLYLGALAVLSGDHAAGRAMLPAAIADLVAAGRNALAALGHAVLASSSLREDEPADATRSLQHAVELYRLAGNENGVASATVWLAAAAVAAQDPERARRHLAEAGRAIADSRDESLTAALVRVAATCAAVDGRFDLAVELDAAEAGIRERGPGYPTPTGRVEPSVAQAWRALGPKRAAEHWHRGAALGAADALDRAAGRADERTPDVLSPREREVARLVAKGLSSSKIARLFVISARTVDTHVDHIRSKLRLHSRAEVAAWATSVGLV
jgi:predicted ATPase/DNA-binding CsgD family transcriptional regulator